MNTEAEDADDHVASMVDKVEVDQNVMPTLCKCTKITHHTHRQENTVDHLTNHKSHL